MLDPAGKAHWQPLTTQVVGEGPFWRDTQGRLVGRREQPSRPGRYGLVQLDTTIGPEPDYALLTADVIWPERTPRVQWSVGENGVFWVRPPGGNYQAVPVGEYCAIRVPRSLRYCLTITRVATACWPATTGTLSAMSMQWVILSLKKYRPLQLPSKLPGLAAICGHQRRPVRDASPAWRGYPRGPGYFFVFDL